MESFTRVLQLKLMTSLQHGVNDNKITCYFKKYCFSEISFDFQFSYTTSHLCFLKKCLIMNLLIMGVYFSLKKILVLK